MWDKFEIIHEGTQQIRQTKADILSHEYELFQMKKDKKIGEMFERMLVVTSSIFCRAKLP